MSSLPIPHFLSLELEVRISRIASMAKVKECLPQLECLDVFDEIVSFNGNRAQRPLEIFRTYSQENTHRISQTKSVKFS